MQIIKIKNPIWVFTHFISLFILMSPNALGSQDDKCILNNSCFRREIISNILEDYSKRQMKLDNDIEKRLTPRKLKGVQLRRFPYPYKGMLAIASDADKTRYKTFKESFEYYRTGRETKYGVGLGLDITHSVCAYVRPRFFGFFNRNNPTDSLETRYYRLIGEYIRRGWIDTLHSYGEFDSHPFRREMASRTLRYLNQITPNIEVWTNHGNPEINFDIIYFQTSNKKKYFFSNMPDADSYHTDLTFNYGIKFIRDGGGIIGEKSIIHPQKTVDGHLVWGFGHFSHVRMDMERFGIKRKVIPLWLLRLLDIQLDEKILQKIVDDGLFSVISQHLGQPDAFIPEFQDCLNDENRSSIPVAAQKGLERLRNWQDDGKILVAGLKRLLEYNRINDHLHFDVNQKNGRISINILRVEDPVLGVEIPNIDQLSGITFLLPKNLERADLYIAGKQIPSNKIIRNLGDNFPYVGIKWQLPDIETGNIHLDSAETLPMKNESDKSMNEIWQMVEYGYNFISQKIVELLR